MKPNNTLAIELVMSNTCNFSCKYCNIGHELTRNKKKETINYDNVINFIDGLLASDAYKNTNFSINFWGGEPSIEYKLINKIIDYYLHNDRISFLLYTNGSDQLFKIDFYKIINLPETKNNEGKFKVQISYDGNPNHDLNRLTKQNNPTSKIIKDNINKFTSLINETNNIYLKLKSTIDFNGFKNLFQSWLDVYELGQIYNNGRNIDLDYALTANTNNKLITLNDDLFEMYNKDLHTNMMEILKYILINNIERPRFSWLIPSFDRKLCSFGAQLITIDVDDNLYSCHDFYSNKDSLYIGNICDTNIISDLNLARKRYRDLINLETQPKECLDCSASFCLRCNISCLDVSAKKNINDKIVDYPSCHYNCKLYKNLNKYRLSFFRMKQKMEK